MAVRTGRAPTRCPQCNKLLPGRPYLPSGGPLGNQSYCSFECAHAAGNRDDCEPGCGCTGFERMCSLNRMYRASMQVMDGIIVDHGLSRELFDRSDEAGAYVFDVDHNADDEPDPEKVLQAEVAALRAERDELERLRTITNMAAAVLDHGAVVRDLERARMALEDSRGLR